MARRTCVGWVLGAAIGIPAALVAAVFLSAVHELEDVLWHDLPRELGQTAPPWYLVIGLPVVGAALVVIARRLLPGDGGHRLSDGLAATPTPPSAAPGIALAALAPSPSEQCRGPRPRSRAGIGARLALAGRLDLGERENAVLSTAGSFSAISGSSAGLWWPGCCSWRRGSAWERRWCPPFCRDWSRRRAATSSSRGWVTGRSRDPSLAVPHLPAYEGTSVEWPKAHSVLWSSWWRPRRWATRSVWAPAFAAVRCSRRSSWASGWPHSPSSFSTSPPPWRWPSEPRRACRGDPPAPRPAAVRRSAGGRIRPRRDPAAVFAGSAAWLVPTALDRRVSPAPAAG
jgi:hypothetical protein